MKHSTWIEINSAQLVKNIRAIRAHVGPKIRVCLPVKANAYGHGLVSVARAVLEHVDYFAVACLQEGKQLRDAGVKKPILLLGAVAAEQVTDAIAYGLELTVSSCYKAELIGLAARTQQRPCRVHVEIETGMQRTGVRSEKAQQLLDMVESQRELHIVGIYSHLATADNPDHDKTNDQISTFASLLCNIKKRYPHIIAHIANSGGVVHYPQSYFDMVRPGLLAFGYFNVPDKHARLQDIAPFFSLKSRVAYFKVVAAQKGISYGHNYVTSEQTRVVTIPIGYGDGYRRVLSNRGVVIIRGKRYRIAGTICMDQLMVDIGSDTAYVGDEVVLIGRQNNSEITVQELAQLCDTIPYEIVCGFTERIVRKMI